MADKKLQLKIGEWYTKAQLRIEPKHKEEYLFVSIGYSKYRNELHKDGIVHEPGKAEHLVQGKQDKYPARQHIFVQFFYRSSQFQYLGELDIRERYDKDRNKLFFKTAKMATVTKKS